MKTFILAFIISFNAAAECQKNVQKLTQGNVVPCTGWLVSEPTMQKFAKTADELELQKKLVQSMEHLQKLDNEEIEFYKRRSDAGEKALAQSERQKAWLAIGAFALGVIATGVAAKAAIESTR